MLLVAFPYDLLGVDCLLLSAINRLVGWQGGRLAFPIGLLDLPLPIRPRLSRLAGSKKHAEELPPSFATIEALSLAN